MHDVGHVPLVRVHTNMHDVGHIPLVIDGFNLGNVSAAPVTVCSGRGGRGQSGGERGGQGLCHGLV